MIRQFDKLTTKEQSLLYRAPVLVSVLASCSFNEVNAIQKADAFKLAHMKTFSAEPLLIPYYKEVEKKFKTQFEATVEKYSPFDEEKRNALKEEMDKVNLVIGKLDKRYAQLLYKSLEKYAKHVKRSAHSVFQDFVFPMPIKGLSY